MKVSKKLFIDVDDWNDFVESVYGRPYSFEKQEGGRERGVYLFSVPTYFKDYKDDSVEDRHCSWGVSFEAWKNADPSSNPLDVECVYDWRIKLAWKRSFYPDVTMVINDLYSRGLLDEGDYVINLDW
jgi:hypothetical protein